jgi:hypothetical protein
MTHYPSHGAYISATTGKTKFDHVLDDANLGEDRTAVALYANFIMHTSPGWRPSGAAREAVRQYREDPDRIRNRKSGEAP